MGQGWRIFTRDTHLLVAHFKYACGPDILPSSRRQNYHLSFQADFVAAFAQANLGDVSPNTAGPKCIDTGEYMIG